VRLWQALLPDQERVLGADHADTLRTRANIAAWIAAIQKPRRQPFLGLNMPVDCRRSIATWFARAAVGRLRRWSATILGSVCRHHLH
jgi:hypothetical protein